MGYAHKLRTLAIGQQVAFLTAVVATARLMALEEAEIKFEEDVEGLEQIGTLAPNSDSEVLFHGVSATLKGRCTFEDDLYLLHSMFGSVAPGGAGPYTWDYSAPHGSVYVPKMYTFEYGVGTAAYKATGMMLRKIKQSLKKRGLWMYEAEFLGQSLSTLGGFASLSDRAVASQRAADTLLYIDAVGGTVGTTIASNTLIEAALEIDTGIEPMDYVGALTAQDYGLNRWTGSMELTAEFNAAAKVITDELISGVKVERQYQLKTTSGTKIAKRSFAGTLDGAGTVLWEDEKGNMAIKWKVIPVYNTALANWLKIHYTNNVATLV